MDFKLNIIPSPPDEQDFNADQILAKTNLPKYLIYDTMEIRTKVLKVVVLFKLRGLYEEDRRTDISLNQHMSPNLFTIA